MTQFSSFRSRWRIPIRARSYTACTICWKMKRAIASEKCRCFSTHSKRSEDERRIIGAVGGDGGVETPTEECGSSAEGARGKSEKLEGGVMGGDGRYAGCCGVSYRQAFPWYSIICEESGSE